MWEQDNINRGFFFAITESYYHSKKKAMYRTFTRSQMLQCMQTTCDIEMTENYH